MVIPPYRWRFAISQNSPRHARVVRVASAWLPRAACWTRGREMNKIHRQALLGQAGVNLGEVCREHLQ